MGPEEEHADEQLPAVELERADDHVPEGDGVADTDAGARQSGAYDLPVTEDCEDPLPSGAGVTDIDPTAMAVEWVVPVPGADRDRRMAPSPPLAIGSATPLHSRSRPTTRDGTHSQRPPTPESPAVGPAPRLSPGGAARSGPATSSRASSSSQRRSVDAASHESALDASRRVQHFQLLQQERQRRTALGRADSPALLTGATASGAAPPPLRLGPTHPSPQYPAGQHMHRPLDFPQRAGQHQQQQQQHHHHHHHHQHEQQRAVDTKQPRTSFAWSRSDGQPVVRAATRSPPPVPADLLPPPPPPRSLQLPRTLGALPVSPELRAAQQQQQQQQQQRRSPAPGSHEVQVARAVAQAVAAGTVLPASEVPFTRSRSVPPPQPLRRSPSPQMLRAMRAAVAAAVPAGDDVFAGAADAIEHALPRAEAGRGAAVLGLGAGAVTEEVTRFLRMMPHVRETERMVQSLRRHPTPTVPITWLDHLDADAEALLAGRLTGTLPKPADERARSDGRRWASADAHADAFLRVHAPQADQAAERPEALLRRQQDEHRRAVRAVQLQDSGDAMQMVLPPQYEYQAHAAASDRGLPTAERPQHERPGPLPAAKQPDERPRTPPAVQYFSRHVATASDLELLAQQRTRLASEQRPDAVARADPALSPFRTASPLQRLASAAHGRHVSSASGPRPAPLRRRSAPCPEPAPMRSHTAPRLQPHVDPLVEQLQRAAQARLERLGDGLRGTSPPRIEARASPPPPPPPPFPSVDAGADVPGGVDAAAVRAASTAAAVGAPRLPPTYATAVRFVLPGPRPDSAEAALRRVLREGVYVCGSDSEQDAQLRAAAVFAAAQHGAARWLQPDHSIPDPAAVAASVPVGVESVFSQAASVAAGAYASSAAVSVAVAPVSSAVGGAPQAESVDARPETPMLYVPPPSRERGYDSHAATVMARRLHDARQRRQQQQRRLLKMGSATAGMVSGASAPAAPTPAKTAAPVPVGSGTAAEAETGTAGGGARVAVAVHTWNSPQRMPRTVFHR